MEISVTGEINKISNHFFKDELIAISLNTIIENDIIDIDDVFKVKNIFKADNKFPLKVIVNRRTGGIDLANFPYFNFRFNASGRLGSLDGEIVLMAMSIRKEEERRNRRSPLEDASMGWGAVYTNEASNPTTTMTTGVYEMPGRPTRGQAQSTSEERLSREILAAAARNYRNTVSEQIFYSLDDIAQTSEEVTNG